MEKFKDTLREADVRITKEKKKMKTGLEQDIQGFAQSIKDRCARRTPRLPAWPSEALQTKQSLEGVGSRLVVVFVDLGLDVGVGLGGGGGAE